MFINSEKDKWGYNHKTEYNIAIKFTELQGRKDS